MFRSASRAVLRQTQPFRIAHRQTGQRFISTAPPSQKSRSWKSTAVRWGLAVAAVYYYNTSTVFAEQPSQAVALEQPSQKENDDDSSLPTIESVAAAKKRKPAPRALSPSTSQTSDSDHELEESPHSQTPQLTGAIAETEESGPADAQPLQLSASELEEEAGQEGAFNPETGEINWDCPCLGGMAHGPCGEDFKEAFSCFVYSTEEPKGMDCIDKFKNMQDCFRLHPEIYGSELDEDEVDEQLKEHIAAEDAKSQSSSNPTTSDAPVSEHEERKSLEVEDVQQVPIEGKKSEGKPEE
ncbi:coiled-coil-helix-coiled-coil-helix domain-containing protein 4 [Uncinocarpus reesii 1704]|uniref:Mitochondrial intermembrane space import and assembly protein 40 n=1 Tax=Uncinocarpus reesii (strain UAMH 1704) TaxID=336963 RepID=C4JXL1_UNCRE|nr:coiled-coil-helix-coiled-coil-helix domain-containing protein 4 [Uncinocarpus reesii 1704]EEP81519.1 coiled-coil-helix-coiled-coil-helix domain-containing protein 4 [Uncinocarpus reesii 1704]